LLTTSSSSAANHPEAGKENELKLCSQSPRGWNVACPQEEKILVLGADIKSIKKKASKKVF
jgi:hypothetical protein